MRTRQKSAARIIIKTGIKRMNRDSALAFRIIKARRTGCGEFRNLTFTPENVWTVFDRDCADMFRNVSLPVGDIPKTLVPYGSRHIESVRYGNRVLGAPEIEQLLLDAGIPGLFEGSGSGRNAPGRKRAKEKESGGDAERVQFPFPLRMS